MTKKTLLSWIFFCMASSYTLFAQEALKSLEEEYYDFLALQGLVEHPALNYRTLSDSVWNTGQLTEHLWQDHKLSIVHVLPGDFRARIYGPELFMSVNTIAPHGQNDGALWQGRGFNASVTGGLRLEGHGLELTFKPQLVFSQNASYDIMPSDYDSEYGYFWGYTHNVGIDFPQRFGNGSVFRYDWGDSEIRFTWKTFTVGAGTQPVWLGPAYLNPTLHSNNAPAYPKFDIGLRKQDVTLPWLKWYLGKVEARLWMGRLTESDYFDNNNSNNYTMIHGLAFAYNPSFAPGVTLFLNWVDLLPWTISNLKYFLPFNTKNSMDDDMKLSLGLRWHFPGIGFELFGELGIDDYVYGDELGLIKYPFMTTVYNLGFRKYIPLSPQKELYGELIFEFNWIERKYSSAYSFYFHHRVVHGYTNEGQLLGNGSGPGGNSQYLAFIFYYPQGKTQVSLHRNNPDNNYLYSTRNDGFVNERGNFIIGAETTYFLTSFFSLSGGLDYHLIINEGYVRREEIPDENGRLILGKDTYRHNVSLSLSAKLSF